MADQHAEGSDRRVSRTDAQELWSRYKQTGDLGTRNQLVLTLSPLVRYIVFRKVRELPNRCEVDDFISCGWEALIHAIDRYDGSRGTTLEQFAWTRIQGAVIDELRRQDWAPRSLRRREREISRAREAFLGEHGRPPSLAELALLTEMSEPELRKHQDSLEVADVGSLNSVVSADGDSTIERVDTIASRNRGYDPELSAEGHHAKRRFRQAFSSLPERERRVAVMLYASEFTLREIGAELGVSESRVCQIHAALKRRLRAQLVDEQELFAAV